MLINCKLKNECSQTDKLHQQSTLNIKKKQQKLRVIMKARVLVIMNYNTFLKQCTYIHFKMQLQINYENKSNIQNGSKSGFLSKVPASLLRALKIGKLCFNTRFSLNMKSYLWKNFTTQKRLCFLEKCKDYFDATTQYTFS